jgi:hypothetical protein
MQGRIVLSKWMTRSCEISELGEAEARLELASFMVAPATFTLLIPGKKPLSVRLAWQQGRQSRGLLWNHGLCPGHRVLATAPSPTLPDRSRAARHGLRNK